MIYRSADRRATTGGAVGDYHAGREDYNSSGTIRWSCPPRPPTNRLPSVG